MDRLAAGLRSIAEAILMGEIGDEAALEAAKKNRRPAVIEVMTDGTRLAPPFRRDALALPTRYLPKYEHLDKSNFK